VTNNRYFVKLPYL